MKPYLIFNLHDLKYGIDPIVVQEIFLLPELTPIAESPLDIIGVLNLRGKIIPVMHLDLRLGNQSLECHLSDSVIVIKWEDLQVGVVVNNVQEVVTIDSEFIQTEVDYGRHKVNPAFISGIAKVDEEIIFLLNPEALIREPNAVEDLFNQSNQEEFNSSEEILDLEDDESKVKEDQDQVQFVSNFYELCCPNATSGEKEVFRRRAESLAKVSLEETADASEQIPLAVVGFNGEYYGIDLATVREFTNIDSFSSIPCCPEHIIGNMNLRGEILTLVDIRSVLNLTVNTVKTGTKAVVVKVDDIVAGLPVDEVLDIIYIDSKDINSVPIAVDTNFDYVQGNTSYLDQLITIIDLSKIMTEGELIVNQSV